jgi:signal peptidase I
MERKGWIAVALGLVMTGLAQIYNGQMLKGVCLYLCSLILVVVGFGVSVYLHDRYLFMGLLLTLALMIVIYIFSIIDGYRTAIAKGTGYRLKAYNRWYVYLAIWIIGPVIITGLATGYIRDNIIQAFKIPSLSMEPTIMRGDRILVDKVTYKRRPPQIGDIIVFVYPDDRSKNYIKRVKGLPGETVKAGDGREYPVPHGSVFVMSDNKEHGLDSRYFGPVPLADVVGKARLVFFSAGKEGVRWGRIGLGLAPSN